VKRMRKILFAGFCFLSGLTGAFAQEVLLGTTSSAAGDLYQIDPTTGTATHIGFLQDGSFAQFGVTGLAFDSVTGVLYGSTSNNSATDKQSLVSIDPNTGFVTFIGAFNVGSNTMADLTFDVATATLYGTGSKDGNLYSINTATGVATAVGSGSGLTGPFRGNALAVNGSGQLFGAPLGASGSLVQFSKTSGAATPVATLSGAQFPAGTIAAMAFNSGGTLYGVNINDTSFATELVTIDPATAAISNIGASVDALDAIVFYNPTAVPEPTTTVLFGAGLVFLTITGIRRYHRRSSAS
jgi:PEP-CTERM motif